jgi:hypothetical protein
MNWRSIVNWLGIMLAIMLAVTGGLYALYMIAYPTKVFRYRLTIETEVDGKVISGSGVLATTLSKNAQLTGSMPPENWGFQGEAVAVDLGHGILFVTLEGKNTSIRGKLIDLSPNSLQQMQKSMKVVLRRDEYPYLVSFKDVNNPKSVFLVDPDNLKAAFGPGVSLRQITLETTDDPVTVGIEKKLPWIKAYSEVFGGGPIATWPKPEQNLSRDDFTRGLTTESLSVKPQTTLKDKFIIVSFLIFLFVCVHYKLIFVLLVFVIIGYCFNVSSIQK